MRSRDYRTAAEDLRHVPGAGTPVDCNANRRWQTDLPPFRSRGLFRGYEIQKHWRNRALFLVEALEFVPRLGRLHLSGKKGRFRKQRDSPRYP